MNEEQKEPKFKVVDRRHFTEDGEVRDDSQVAEDDAPQASAAAADEATPDAGNEPQQAQSQDAGNAQTNGQVPPLNFAQFVLSLASSVQIALGLMPNPATNTTMKNLAAAQQTIDILAMLQEKTQGNLSADEDKLMQELMYTLRMQFVEVSKSA